MINDRSVRSFLGLGRALLFILIWRKSGENRRAETSIHMRDIDWFEALIDNSRNWC